MSGVLRPFNFPAVGTFGGGANDGYNFEVASGETNVLHMPWHPNPAILSGAWNSFDDAYWEVVEANGSPHGIDGKPYGAYLGFVSPEISYDFNSANELIGTWKQISMIDKTKEVKKAEKVKRQKAMRQISSETRSSGDSVGGKKMYRRSDLINLQVSDPNRYADLADEIQLAYAEGRVR